MAQSFSISRVCKTAASQFYSRVHGRTKFELNCDERTFLPEKLFCDLTDSELYEDKISWEQLQ